MIFNEEPKKLKNFESSWISPSNIALVKYWGKKGHQLPANPSVSLTLKDCQTKTDVVFTQSQNFEVELFLDGEKNEKFAEKIKKYLLSLNQNWLYQFHYKISTKNTFPHGTGIASSASGLSAFCLCLTDFYYELTEKKDDEFFRLASSLSRLASGSASRSVFGEVVVWGEDTECHSSDLWATKFKTHPIFESMLDSVLIVSNEEKKVSSTAGHSQMSDHFFKAARFEQAKYHFDLMKKALKTGDLDLFGTVLEAEALSLHAMMMTSPSPYTLLRPETLKLIECIKDFRLQTEIPVYFTLDAGPNLHLLYPHEHLEKVRTFIQNELSSHYQQVIHDEVGSGPIKC